MKRFLRRLMFWRKKPGPEVILKSLREAIVELDIRKHTWVIESDSRQALLGHLMADAED